MASQIFLVVIVSFYIVKVNSFERIITKENDTIYRTPRDYRYREIFYFPYGFKSLPGGCPKSKVGRGILPCVQHREKCCLVDDPGLPCKNGEKLFVKAGITFGLCNCPCFEHGNIPLVDFNKVQFCKAESQEYVYLPMSRDCFKLNYQGPCRESERLVKIRNKRGFGTDRDGWTAICEETQSPTGEMSSGIDGGNAGGMSANAVLRHDCKIGEIYSRLLRKCIYKSSRGKIIGK